MTKTIDTVVEDANDVLMNPDKYDLDIDALAQRLAATIKAKLEYVSDPKIRMSNYGTPDRKMWYSINEPEKAEPLPPEAIRKFLYGDIIEEIELWYIETSGHKVEGRQDKLQVGDVVGHRDAVIDGETVDVKSTSSFGYFKFAEEGKLNTDDPFHYLDQLNLYMEAGQDDPIVTNKERGHFLAVDKQLGKVCLSTYPYVKKDYDKETKRKQEMLASKEPPKRCYFPKPDGKAGNMKLDTACSYCAFKKTCWPGLRTFLYANGPRFLTTVKKVPDVPEAK